jgi:hypothetical protein
MATLELQLQWLFPCEETVDLSFKNPFDAKYHPIPEYQRQ